MQNLTVRMKSAVRRLIAPFARPVWRRIKPRLVQFDQLVKLNDAWHQHLPALVNATASVGAVAREQARMKREYDSALAELRTAIGQLQPQLAQETRIIAVEKVERARTTGAKLVLGDKPSGGYIHVDTRGTHGADIVSPLAALPFAPAEVTEIFACHVLERFTQEELERKLLPHWVSRLTPGGRFRAVATDSKAMIQAAARGELRLDDFRSAVFGQDGDAAHRNLFSAESLSALLQAAGMVDVQVIAESRRAGAAYEFEIVARTAAL
jgi:hypothetical protein